MRLSLRVVGRDLSAFLALSLVACTPAARIAVDDGGTPPVEPDAAPTMPSDGGPVSTIAPLPTGEAHFGHTHAELAAAWWQWVFGLPQERHPLLDAEGDDCTVGQPDGVFFLAGTFGGPAHRTCVVPTETPLFFPVVNNVVDNGRRAPDMHVPEAELAAYVETWADGVDEMSLEIDGRSWSSDELRELRAAARFAYDLSDEHPNLYDLRGVVFDGVVDPAFTDGIWIYLPPLPAGAHHIHFTAEEVGDPDVGIRAFSVDVEYDLEVR